jgi:superfamily I DNA/RNA helicase
MVKLTNEQQEIIGATESLNNSVMLINAYAGAGKTSTLKAITETYSKNSFLYLVYNKKMKEEAEEKFPRNCTVKTMHSLAYNLFARNYFGSSLQYRLNLRWRNKDFVEHFNFSGIYGFSKYAVSYAGRKTLDAFKNSAETQINEGHIPREIHIKYLSKLKYSDRDRAERLAIHAANEIWLSEKQKKADTPITHDSYLKLFELHDPQILGYDYFLVDEAQDVNPVVESILNKNTGNKILVGDSFQAIYGWRGAQNTLERLAKSDNLKTYFLTKSWRFGPEIAEKATKLIRTVSKETPEVKGNKPSEYKEYVNFDEILKKGDTVLFRTNAGVLDFVYRRFLEDKSVEVIGGLKSFYDRFNELYHIKKGLELPTKNSRYAIFNNINEIITEGETDREVEADLKVLESIGDVEFVKFINSLKQELKSNKKADYRASTTHKAKGLEWETVVLGTDFRPADYRFAINQEELKIVYVVLTRASNLHLDSPF